MESRIYVGTEEGIVTLESADGRAWEQESHGLQSWEVSAVAVVPNHPNQVLAGTRGDGVWLSEDAGRSWRKPSYGKRGPGKVRCLTIDPQNPNRVYAGCEPIDIFVSDDLGTSWDRLDSVWDVPFVATVPYPVATVEPHARDITIDPRNPSTIYAALQVGFMLKTTDAGKTWTLLDKDFDCDVHTIVLDPSNPSKVFIATGGGESRQGRVKGRALYASADGGESWSPTAMEFTQEYSVPLIMSPSNPKVMYSALAHGNPSRWRQRESGAEGLLVRTTDGGSTWESVGQNLAGLDKEFAEAIVVDPQDASNVFAGCRSGSFLGSHDGGESWESLQLRVPSVTSAELARFA